MSEIDLMVLDVGQYGFVKLQYYHHPFGLDETGSYTSDRDLFNELWDERLSTLLLAFTHGSSGLSGYVPESAC